MIKVKNISKKYDKYIFKNFTYEFNKGLYIVVGKSGIGKTTLLNILKGTDKDFEGKINAEEEVLYFKDSKNLPSNLTVKEAFCLFEHAQNTKIKLYFDITKLYSKKIKKLSLGEQQLVVLNMVLNSTSKIIILDEPFSALSSSNLELAIKEIENISKEKVVIIASHIREDFFNANIINLEEKFKRSKVKDFESKTLKPSKKYKFYYSFLYFKKTFFKKVIFLFSIVITIYNFNYINKYVNDMKQEYLKEIFIDKGEIIEKKNEIKEINDLSFYEVIKKISHYVIDYNANYYSSDLYNYNISVDNYYIDNGFILSSIEYVEYNLKEDEVIFGINYSEFCSNNNLFSCDENHLKTLLINKKINDFNLKIKDIYYSDVTRAFSNKRFNKIRNNNEYVEYYFDINKNDLNNVFNVINNDDFLMEFDYIKLKESDEKIRYKVDIDGKKNFKNNIEYNKYIVCLEKGYNCFNFINPFSSLKSIDLIYDLSELDFELIEKELSLNEIVISSKLSNILNKKEGEYITFNFEYNNKIESYYLLIKNVIKNDRVLIYQNSQWSYLFFKEMLDFNEEDLQIKNIVIKEDIKEGYIKSENIYKETLIYMEKLVDKMYGYIYYVNLFFTVSGIVILILLELFYNRFKKEYFAYLNILNVNKKMFQKKHLVY